MTVTYKPTNVVISPSIRYSGTSAYNVRIVEGLEFVNTEKIKEFVRIVEGLEFVNTENGKHNVRIVEGLEFVNTELFIIVLLNFIKI